MVLIAKVANIGNIGNIATFAIMAGIANIVNIAIAPIPNTGLGEAINDRLRRAAAPR